jgi:hypothetical protein
MDETCPNVFIKILTYISKPLLSREIYFDGLYELNWIFKYIIEKISASDITLTNLIFKFNFLLILDFLIEFGFSFRYLMKKILYKNLNKFHQISLILNNILEQKLMKMKK